MAIEVYKDGSLVSLPETEPENKLMIGSAKPFDLDSMNGLERKEVLIGGKKSDNFVISKATTIDNRPEKAQANQRAKILKTSINDRYVADHYYQNTNMDEILFERDGTISKMRQFDYKVHKFIKKK